MVGPSGGVPLKCRPSDKRDISVMFVPRRYGVCKVNRGKQNPVVVHVIHRGSRTEICGFAGNAGFSERINDNVIWTPAMITISGVIEYTPTMLLLPLFNHESICCQVRTGPSEYRGRSGGAPPFDHFYWAPYTNASPLNNEQKKKPLQFFKKWLGPIFNFPVSKNDSVRARLLRYLNTVSHSADEEQERVARVFFLNYIFRT